MKRVLSAENPARNHPTLCGVPFRASRWRDEFLQPGLTPVYTVNMEFLYWSLTLDRFRRALEHGYNTADGKWVVWLLNMKYGRGTVEHLPGSRLTYKILDAASSMGLSVAFVGSTWEILQRVREIVEARWTVRVEVYSPGVVPLVPARDHPEVSRIEEFLRSARPDILFVSLGPPKQEILIDLLIPVLEESGTRLAMGIGGTVHMIAGVEKQSPGIVSRMGLEWLWRLAQNPGRWRKVARSLRALMCGISEVMRYRFLRLSS